MRVATGLREVDRCLGGGLPAGLIEVSGRAGAGKTQLALHLAAHAAERGGSVLIYVFSNSELERIFPKRFLSWGLKTLFVSAGGG